MDDCPNCTLVREGWTTAQARDAVLAALRAFTDQPIPHDVTFAELGLDPPKVLQLWGKFFVAVDTDLRQRPDGSTEYLHPEKLPPMPTTVGKLIAAVWEHYKDPTYRACDLHAY